MTTLIDRSPEQIRAMPAGVAVTAAQSRGGPWPSTTNALSTRAGDTATSSLLRPVALPGAPAWLIQARSQI